MSVATPPLTTATDTKATDRLNQLLLDWQSSGAFLKCDFRIEQGYDLSGQLKPGDRPTLVVVACTTFSAFGDQWKRLDELERAGVALVWIVNAHIRTVTVYRNGQQPSMVNDTQELCGDPELPGFRVPVARLFE